MSAPEAGAPTPGAYRVEPSENVRGAFHHVKGPNGIVYASDGTFVSAERMRDFLNAAYAAGLEAAARVCDKRANIRDEHADRGDEAAAYEAEWCRADARAIRALAAQPVVVSGETRELVRNPGGGERDASSPADEAGPVSEPARPLPAAGAVPNYADGYIAALFHTADEHMSCADPAPDKRTAFAWGWSACVEYIGRVAIERASDENRALPGADQKGARG